MSSRAFALSASRANIWRSLTGERGLPVHTIAAFSQTDKAHKYRIDLDRLTFWQKSALAAHIARANGISYRAAQRSMELPIIATNSVNVLPDGVLPESVRPVEQLAIDSVGGWVYA